LIAFPHLRQSHLQKIHHQQKKSKVQYHRQTGLQIKVARIFNTYGPRIRRAAGRVVSNFTAQPLADGPITLYGEANQIRSINSQS